MRHHITFALKIHKVRRGIAFLTLLMDKPSVSEVDFRAMQSVDVDESELSLLSSR